MSWVLLPIVLPIVAALISATEKLFPRWRVAVPATLIALGGQLWFALASGLALLATAGGANGTAIASLGFLHTVVGEYPAGVGISLVLDGPGWVVGTVITVVALASVLFAAADRRVYTGTFYVFTNLLIAGMHGAVLTDDLFNMFVFLEIIGIAAYLLIIYQRKGHAVLASFRYLMLSSVAMALFLIGVFIIYRETGTFGMRAGWLVIRDGATARIGVAALVVGVGVRAAFVPLHSWLPDAHAYAPHPVSALLSGVMIKVSLVALIRVLNYTVIPASHELKMWVGVLTAVVGVVMALAQVDAKRLLAYSSVSQMGYMVAVAGAAAWAGAGGLAIYGHVVTHALSKAALFLVLGLLIDRLGERDLRRMGGAARRFPGLAVLFVIAAIAIVGLPPSSGFATKKLLEETVAAAWPFGGTLLGAVSALTAAAMIRLGGAFFAPAPADAPQPPPHDVHRPWLAALGPAVLAATIVLLSAVQTPVGQALGVKNPYSAAAVPAVGAVVVGALLITATMRGAWMQRVLATLRQGQVGLQGLLFLMVGVFVVLAAATPVLAAVL